jgi:hypothetical protein
VKLLTVENAKTVKGESLGYLTGILYLAPANESGVMNTCQFATAGCKAACLYTAGRASFIPMIGQARVRKTVWLHNDRAGFLDQLRADIRALVRRAARMHLAPAVRVNGTSDMPWMALQLSAEFPDVQFYDYTKLPRPWLRTRPNYSITFSLSESNLPDAIAALQNGINLAVVFNTPKGKPLPDTWNGFGVTDGDTHDLRFLDAHRLGTVIGLHAKGRAKKDTSGFVQIAPAV